MRKLIFACVAAARRGSGRLSGHRRQRFRCDCVCGASVLAHARNL